MPITDEYVETAFIDEYARLKQAGIDKLVEQRIDKLLFLMYRRGYIRGHSDRSREVLREEEQAIREGRTMGLDLKYEDDRLILSSGRDITPNKEADPPPAFLPPKGPSYDPSGRGASDPPRDEASLGNVPGRHRLPGRSG